tara:strand:- start:2013 stop:2708 length:696 start_codon:yes stop_codon:yes gene_type:complete
LNPEDLNVTILAYSRPETFKKVFDSCAENLKKITVVIDKPSNKLIAKKQEQILDITFNANIHCVIVKRAEKYGLVRSVLTAVEDGLKKQDHVVMLEDDCLPNENFFKFVADNLDKHRDDPSISTICGTRTSCDFNPWGWATWRHKWDYQNITISEILKIAKLPLSLRDFLENNNVEDSIWSLNWLAYQYKNNCSSAFPKKNLITNIGLDNSGVHDHQKGYTGWLLSQIMKD